MSYDLAEDVPHSLRMSALPWNTWNSATSHAFTVHLMGRAWGGFGQEPRGETGGITSYSHGSGMPIIWIILALCVVKMPALTEAREREGWSDLDRHTNRCHLIRITCNARPGFVSNYVNPRGAACVTSKI